MTEILSKKNVITPAGYKHKCTNCMACYNICPSGAIEMIEDIDGFVYPSIVEDKCTHCGLCSKKCPALNLEQTKEISQRLETPLAYGGYINDEEIRKKSSSGGVFSILAKYVLDKGGCICGARFIRGGICEHVIVDNWEDLTPLRGSKYVQSNINNCFKEIKKLLELDKYVLFTGTPCQVAGLYAVLGKDYEKLITVDLLCHGVPSQKLFREYLNEITENKEEEVENFEFRNKKSGWHTPFIKFDMNRATTYRDWEDCYIKAFLGNLINRQSCVECRFNRLPRQGDFTIGDFWGIENFNCDLDDNKGLSIILLNSPKSESIIKNIEYDFQKIKQFSFESVRGLNMIERKSYNHPYYAYFFNRYSQGEYRTISELIEECLNKKDGIATLNWCDVKHNYGSLLTGYALQQILAQKGYTTLAIRFYDNEKSLDLSNFEDFERKNINYTAPCFSRKDLANLNKYFRTFITGSDIVFMDIGYGPEYRDIFKLNFANFSKNICSYSASFRTEKYEKLIDYEHYPCSDEEKNIAKRLLKRFSHISVREKSGVDICKNDFDVQAQHILDPVFSLTKQEWKSLYNNKDLNEKINVSYILNNEDEELKEYVNNTPDIKKLYTGDNFKYIMYHKGKATGVNVEDWIKYIANSRMFYTDSYHGVCFAIIFNRPFVCFGTGKPNNRLTSLWQILGIPNRFANSVEDIERLKNEPIDWDIVNKKLQEHLKTSEEFLEKILYSHEHPDPVRGYMESLEILAESNTQKIEQMLKNEALKKPGIPPPRKEKWYFLGVHVFKKSMWNGHKWFYIFGIPFIKEVEKEHKTYYKLFGFIRILKKTVRE